MTKRLAVLALVILCVSQVAVRGQQKADLEAPLVIASKPFGESYLVAEMFSQLLERHGVAVRRVHGLGSTEILFAALREGSVDVYPEYTGTGLIAVLRETLTAGQLSDARFVFNRVSTMFLDRYGVRWLPPLGFENTFAIAVRRDTAEKYRLRSLTDLARESRQLRAGLTADFIERPDGLAGLSRIYGLEPASVQPLSPALKYQALANGNVDFIDGFSTDGLLARYELTVLEDDRHFFPPYEAAAVLSARAAARTDVVSALTLLSGRISEPMMRSLNERLEVRREEVGAVAADALRELGLVSTAASSLSADEEQGPMLSAYLWSRRSILFALALRHLYLVALALVAGVLVGIPLGLALERTRRTSGTVLGALGILQTIPSIALLAFLVPLLGIGVAPALAALWLYSLLPITRAAFTGARDADPEVVEAAEALGMTPMQRLFRVRLPLAAPTIMSGVRTAAVICVGTATLAAFIGAGGLGEPIVTGLALADARMVLSGALPAAVLALLVDAVLAVVERWLRPAHLRRV